ncbi:hypothetical protein J0676_17065 [Vibrio sp. Vb2880]|uniref:Uncharacterized protein n=1 Tax=Vibrio furnissii TaxID=29494 RepID=A0A0Q2SAV8_VIBFU|nr:MULTISPECIES: hypothetical protein [Vibrio]ADT87151.1 hypothetical protein vfu_A01995 [Vibrio furnissii NCTC 11218]EEX41740.1 hypothetical protein VFA_001577 [Vibrio furnissii CIP 102972]KQH84539.1 hypothetical protein AMR76_17145 [Vibrio furnissii]MBO0215218.1 hypothetical protein [Vibrio sp. Vb2880]MCG6214278.1 hypothetical protein [Vibrio furnissii]
MLWDTLERVNRLRQEAMSNPEFIQSAREHEETLKHVEQEFEPKRHRKSHSSKPKSLADIYKQADFGHNPSDTQH